MPTLHQVAAAIDPPAFVDWQAQAAQGGLTEDNPGWAILQQQHYERRAKAMQAAERVLALDHVIETTPWVPHDDNLDRQVAVRARLADWAGLGALMEIVVVSSRHREASALAEQWARQLDAIMQPESKR